MIAIPSNFVMGTGRIPTDRHRSYDVRRILSLVLDSESLFEIGRMYGRPLVVGLARLNGYPVGVMANDPKQGGGAVGAAAAEKRIRFIDLCDTFHIPAVKRAAGNHRETTSALRSCCLRSLMRPTDPTWYDLAPTRLNRTEF